MLLLLALAALQDPAEPLLGRLESAEAVERADAERRLQELGDAALPAIRARLDHPDVEVRSRLRSLVRRLEWDALLDPSLLARYAPLRAAYVRGDARAFLDAGYRCEALRLSPHEGVEAWLYHVLDHPEPAVRDSALHALVQWNAPLSRRRPAGRLARLVAAWTPADGLPRLDSLTRLGAALTTPLHREEIFPLKAAHPDADQALRLLQALAGHREAETVILDILRKPGSPVRPAAVRAALRLRYAPARDVMISSLDDPGLFGTAYWDFPRIVDASCEAQVVKILSSRAPKDRGGIFTTLVRQFRWRSATPAYLDVLRQLPPGEWDETLTVLGALGSTEAFDLVFEKFSSPPPHPPRIPDDLFPSEAEKRFRLPDHTAAHLAAMADGPRALRFLALLDATDLRHRNGAAHAVGSFRHPEARAAALERLPRESRPDLRKAMFDSFLGSILHAKQEEASFLAVCDRLARDPAAPLGPSAAAALLRLRGPEALPLAEAVARRSDVLPDDLLAALSLDRPAGLVDVLGRGAERSPGCIALLEVIGSPEAGRELDRLRRTAKAPELRLAAAVAQMRLERKALPELAAYVRSRAGYAPWTEFVDLLRDDAPGFRDAFRADLRARGTEACLWELRTYAEPESIPALRGILFSWDRATPARIANEEMTAGMCATGMPSNRSGIHALQALAATGDRSLAPLFLDRLESPDLDLQITAAEVAGRWNLADAAPRLKRLARAGSGPVRYAAIDALSRLALPGTEEFLRPLLADSPGPVASAMARLKQDLRPELRALYAYEDPPPQVLLAAERMRHPAVYEGLDRAGRLPARVLASDLPTLLGRLLGVPVRFSRRGEALRRRYSHGFESIQPLENPEDLFRTYLPRVRDGVVELVPLDESLDAWRS